MALTPATCERQWRRCLRAKSEQRCAQNYQYCIDRTFRLKGLGAAKRKTYAQAHADIVEHLERRGWKPSGRLKVPYITSPDGSLRLWFKPQAIWYSEATRGGSGHSLKYAASLHVDSRRVDPEKLRAYLKKRYAAG